MDPQPESPAPRLPGAGAISDLPVRGTDMVESLVTLLRDKTVRPLTLATRAVVFGIIIFAASRGHRRPGVRHPHPPPHRLRLRRPGLALRPGGRGPLRHRRPGGLEPAHRLRRPVEGRGMTESRQVVIVGSGPAGLTAAIYASRAQLSPLVIEGEPSSTSDQPGGQLMLTTEVENYPGFVDGIMGPELMQAFREQAARFGAEYLTAKVSRVDLSSRPFGLWVGDPDADEPTYAAEPLIIATGAQSLMLNLPNEERLLGYGVSTCATCDGFFFREKEIAVVGGGDSALEEALFLTRFADKVTVIHRRGELRASKVMQQRAFANPKITFRWNTSVIDVLGDTKVTGVRVRDNLSEEESVIDLSGLFVAIGHQPNTSLFKGQIELEENGYVRTFDGTRTNVDGVFACGDVQDHHYRQAITAAGSGCMAAIDVERWLEDQQAAH